MGLLLLMRWWYSNGWAHAFLQIGARIQSVAGMFSVPILLRTLFEPWKQVTTYAGQSASLDVKMHVLLDNLFARAFGFVIRVIFIILGILVMILTAIASLIIAVVWPAIPALPLLCVIMAVRAL